MDLQEGFPIKKRPKTSSVISVSSVVKSLKASS